MAANTHLPDFWTVGPGPKSIGLRGPFHWALLFFVGLARQERGLIRNLTGQN